MFCFVTVFEVTNKIQLAESKFRQFSMVFQDIGSANTGIGQSVAEDFSEKADKEIEISKRKCIYIYIYISC